MAGLTFFRRFQEDGGLDGSSPPAQEHTQGPKRHPPPGQHTIPHHVLIAPTSYALRVHSDARDIHATTHTHCVTRTRTHAFASPAPAMPPKFLTLPVVVASTKAGTSSSCSHSFILTCLLSAEQDAPPLPVWCGGWDMERGMSGDK